MIMKLSATNEPNLFQKTKNVTIFQGKKKQIIVVSALYKV